ncbi:hypothetical protein PoB_006141600 [Plakobranchus ocellatus]|uniref:Uncharacterized protein n=1 Tax=Plakobranchus ocellatus TaxID=259542 RepID=A0AAV4CSR3_9GAST|nr:hypothetical protein PoB_006141600 [Plakobranchus ocellatus]
MTEGLKDDKITEDLKDNGKTEDDNDDGVPEGVKDDGIITEGLKDDKITEDLKDSGKTEDDNDDGVPEGVKDDGIITEGLKNRMNKDLKNNGLLEVVCVEIEWKCLGMVLLDFKTRSPVCSAKSHSHLKACLHGQGKVAASAVDFFSVSSECAEASKWEELALVHPLYIELLHFLYNWKQESFQKFQKKKDFDDLLIRRKKDDGHQRLPIRKNFMFFSEDKDGSGSESGPSLPSQLVFLLVFIVTVVLVALLVRHACQMVRKKRIISLRSLSATFSLLKMS